MAKALDLESECFFGRHKFDETTGACTRQNCPAQQKNVISIDARKWFSKGPGNTYHSVYATLPDGTVLSVPYAYGYGDQWMETVQDLIAAHLKAEKADHERLHAFLARLGYWAFTRVQDVSRKKDL